MPYNGYQPSFQSPKFWKHMARHELHVFMVMITRMIRRLILCVMVMMQIMIEGLTVIIIDFMIFILTSTFIVVGLIQVTSRVVSRTIIVIVILILKSRVHGHGGDDDGDTG